MQNKSDILSLVWLYLTISIIDGDRSSNLCASFFCASKQEIKKVRKSKLIKNVHKNKNLKSTGYKSWDERLDVPRSPKWAGDRWMFNTETDEMLKSVFFSCLHTNKSSTLHQRSVRVAIYQS